MGLISLAMQTFRSAFVPLLLVLLRALRRQPLRKPTPSRSARRAKCPTRRPRPPRKSFRRRLHAARPAVVGGWSTAGVDGWRPARGDRPQLHHSPRPAPERRAARRSSASGRGSPARGCWSTVSAAILWRCICRRSIRQCRKWRGFATMRHIAALRRRPRVAWWRWWRSLARARRWRNR